MIFFIVIYLGINDESLRLLRDTMLTISRVKSDFFIAILANICIFECSRYDNRNAIEHY